MRSILYFLKNSLGPQFDPWPAMGWPAGRKFLPATRKISKLKITTLDTEYSSIIRALFYLHFINLSGPQFFLWPAIVLTRKSSPATRKIV